MTDDVVRVAKRRGREQRADPFMQREKQSDARGGRPEILVGEQRRRRACQTCAETLALLIGRQVDHSRCFEARVQLAACLLEECECRDELKRGLRMLPRVDELLEIVEREGDFHRFTIIRVCRANDIEETLAGNDDYCCQGVSNKRGMRIWEFSAQVHPIGL